MFDRWPQRTKTMRGLKVVWTAKAMLLASWCLIMNVHTKGESILRCAVRICSNSPIVGNDFYSNRRSYNVIVIIVGA